MSLSAPGETEEEKEHQPECHPIQGSSALSWQEHPQESPRHQEKELWVQWPVSRIHHPREMLGMPHTWHKGAATIQPQAQYLCHRNQLTDQQS